jgi:F-type H+-transporting ATPase subunit b
MEFSPVGFAIQVVTFVILWIVLKRWMFEPALRVIEMRAERASAPLADAARLRRETEALRQRYQADIEAAREAARQELAAARRQAEAEGERVLAAARAEAEKVVQEARSAVAGEVENARSSIARYAAEISVAAAQKVLGRPIQ